MRIEILNPENDRQDFSRERGSQDFLSAKSLEMGVFFKVNTFVREWETDNDIKFKLNYARRSFETEFGFTKANRSKTYRFRLETYFDDVEGEFHTELDTKKNQTRAVTTIRTKFTPKLYFLDEKLGMRNQFEWNLMVLRVGKPRTKKCNSRRWLHIQARQAKSLEDGMRTGLRSLLTAWSSQQAILYQGIPCFPNT